MYHDYITVTPHLLTPPSDILTNMGQRLCTGPGKQRSASDGSDRGCHHDDGTSQLIVTPPEVSDKQHVLGTSPPPSPSSSTPNQSLDTHPITSVNTDDSISDQNTEEDLSDYTAVSPPHITPAEKCIFSENENTVHVKLMPHKHTLFCERKERVCTAVGKVQEREMLKVKGLDEDASIEGCYWIRSAVGDSKAGYEFIPESEGLDRYTLASEDAGRYISFQQTYVHPEKGVSVARAVNSLGPVLPGPPRLLDLKITGSTRCGGRVFAEAEYIGGTQGPSEYWWFKIRSGKRVQLGEPRAIDSSTGDLNFRDNPASDDPRVLEIGENDEGCVLKVKCRPVREDGYKGEVFTSKPSAVITGKEIS